MRIFTRNSRFPEMLKGDLKAIMAACRLGARRLTETVERYGVDALEASFEAMITETEQALRSQIEARIPDGDYAFRDRIDSDAVTDRSYFVDAVLRKRAGTVELDFSETPGITQLKIGSGKPKDFVQTVPVFVVKKEDGIERQEPAEYSIHFACGSRQYHGYIRNLKDNEFTAFVRIPCAIPEKLLDAASRGTVSKFKVQSTGDRQEEVAEIVISGM